ncbi:MAG: mechanosensitive ion channel [Anaerolineae bacterium]|nr:mechanosensitive ion channel [Anaerolineae bacterium]MCO5188809.1 mechanosensitive ion channel [Anaerolineae bacterium]MCO5191840.1 mechanosensitive ion channel [Anaerolineae bacterium]MCO5199662.1 mechanosensitive ion channel [Anaerolineae bacterium]MCO5207468.1 mechanosensitive ion channel [Anaerolineae bacterium]
MIEIAGYQFTLPEALQFLTATFFQFVINLAFWLIVSYVVYFILFHLAKWLVRRIKGDIDDTILDIVRTPLLVILMVFGFAAAVGVLPLPVQILDWTQRIRNFVISLAIVWAVWRLFGEVVIYYGKQHAQRSVDNFDDILLPIVDQFGRIIILVLGTFFTLQQLGIDLTGVWIALGGAAFILAFALQDILSNMFASLAMLVDTPFKYGDFIELDGDIFRVERIGMRVTELYDTHTHTIIFMPNSHLTNEKLVNLTRPTIDLRTTIDIVVSADADPRYVSSVVREVAVSHPNILAPIPTKINLIGDRLVSALSREDWARVIVYTEEITRLEEEHILNERINALSFHIEQLADRVDVMEEDGLDTEERTVINRELDEIGLQIDAMARQLTRWLMAIRYRMAQPIEDTYTAGMLEVLYQRADDYMAWVSERLGDELPIVGTLPEGDVTQIEVKRAISRLVLRHGVDGFDRGFNDVENRRELENLIRSWDYRVCDLREKLNELYEDTEAGNEQRLDDRVRQFEDWIHTHFKETTPEWKYPAVSLVSYDQDSMKLHLEVQIDDILLEYFGRQSRVESELRKDIRYRCQECGISLK